MKPVLAGLAAGAACLALSLHATGPAGARDAAIRKAVAYLTAAQNREGSWGSVKESLSWDVFWSSPEAHRSWRLACTGLACMALMDHSGRLASTAPIERGIDWMLANADVKRCNDWDTDHVWGWIYALEALSRAERFEPLRSRRDAIRPVVDRLIRDLAVYQTPAGGWGYYDFDTPRTRTPRWATSFTTANAVLALREARDTGHALPPGTMKAALKAIHRTRLPGGTYTYTVHAIPSPGEGFPLDENTISPVKWSLSRIQVCNLALHLENDGISEADIARGLDDFIAHHRFLDIACYKPIPHETYYANSGYFYLYGHAYAARLVRLLPPDLRARYGPRIEAEVLKHQEKDGSFWDFPMMGYGKPYGTAFALITLAP